MIGQTISHYRILERIGAGGMGEVYLAEDTELQRKVALKVLPAEMASDPERLERFKREARAVAALNHPNIVTIFSVEQANLEETKRPASVPAGKGEPSSPLLHFLTMELVEGETLATLIPKRGFDLDRFFELAIPMADALATAHDKGIVHRDVKPGNIMVGDEGRVKVLDFGLAKLREADISTEATRLATEAITEEGMAVGTAPYMSPEQVQGKPVDHRSDIFSLGIVLHEMTSGQRPFQGETSADLISSILRDSPESVTELKEDLPRHLARIIRHCLEKNPKDRFQSARDVHNELKGLRREVEAGDLPSSSVSTVIPAAAPGQKWWPAALGAVAVLALVGGLWIFRRGEEPAPAVEEAPATATRSPQRAMLAVLPFENLGSADDEYFADGLTEEITSRLAVMSGLGVISRTSAMQYKENRPPLKQIGEELGVDYLLEGTVRWERPSEGPSRIRVTPQLIRVADDTHLWASRYDRQLEEIFAVQSSIAEEVARELNVTLLEPERAAVEERPTENMEAYQAYLRGMDLWLQPGWDPPRFELSAQMLERAVELDPEFVLPWAQLVSIHGILYAYYDRTDERRAKSKEALDHALALDPDHPAVRLEEGYYHYYVLSDYLSALEKFEAVEKERPNDSDVQQSIAWINRRLGRLEAALDRLHQALAVDPQNAHVNFHIGVTNAALRRFAEADPYFDRAIALAPDTLDMYVTKAEALVRWTGETAAARAVLARGPGNEESLDTWVIFDLQDRDFQGALARLDAVGLHTTDPPDPRPLLHLLRALGHTALGEAGLARQSYEASRVTAEAILEEAPNPFVRGVLANALAGLGRTEEAIGEARVAFEEVANDRFSGVQLRESQAAVLARIGEEDKSIDLLDELLTTSYQDAITVPVLQSQPLWDPLRDHPRFQEMIRDDPS